MDVYLRWTKSVAVVMGSRVVIVVPALVEIVVRLAESKHIINFFGLFEIPQKYGYWADNSKTERADL